MWCRTTPLKITQALGQAGIQVGASTGRRLLTGLMDHPLRVNPSDVDGEVVPNRVHDTLANHAFVNLGISGDTPALAVDSIDHWWQAFGQQRYPGAMQLLILADSGGANSYRSRFRKHRLKQQLCDAHGLTVTVCHYPPGAAKWNPIDHRLFFGITKRWAEEPLTSYATVLPLKSPTWKTRRWRSLPMTQCPSAATPSTARPNRET